MLTCCTALTMPRRVANSTVRSLTSSSGCAVMVCSPRARCAPSPRSCGERVGVRGFFELQILNTRLHTPPPLPCNLTPPPPKPTEQKESHRSLHPPPPPLPPPPPHTAPAPPPA